MNRNLLSGLMMNEYDPEPDEDKEPYKWFAYWFYRLNPDRHSSYWNVPPATEEDRKKIAFIRVKTD